MTFFLFLLNTHATSSGYQWSPPFLSPCKKERVKRKCAAAEPHSAPPCGSSKKASRLFLPRTDLPVRQGCPFTPACGGPSDEDDIQACHTICTILLPSSADEGGMEGGGSDGGNKKNPRSSLEERGVRAANQAARLPTTMMRWRAHRSCVFV